MPAGDDIYSQGPDTAERVPSLYRLDIDKAIDFVRDHKHDDAALGKAARRVFMRGGAADIMKFVAGLVEIFQAQEGPSSNTTRSKQSTASRGGRQVDVSL